MSLQRYMRATCAGAVIRLTAMAAASIVLVGSAEAQTTKTMPAAEFLGTVGVNIHTPYTDGGYADPQAVLRSLSYLGVDRVRDQTLDPNNQGQANYGVLADAGIKYTIMIPGGSKIPDALARLAEFERAHPGAVVAIEGPNEVNNWPVTYGGKTGTAGAILFQKALYDAVNEGPLRKLKVYNLTSWPDLAGQADLSNFHAYPSGGDQPYNALAENFAIQKKLMAAKDVVLTEAGYYTLPGGGTWGGVDQATQAKQILNMIFDSAALGIRQIFLYQLLDAYPDPEKKDMERHFGLFDIDYRPKPAAESIHNLTRILGEPRSDRNPGAMRPVKFSLADLPSTARWMVLTKSAGETLIVIWAEPDIWDGKSHTPIAAPKHAVTVRFDQPQRAEVYDPLIGLGPLQTIQSERSVRVEVTDHPVIVQVGAPRAKIAGAR